MHGFVRSYSCAEGLPGRYFEINLNLKYYRIGFKLQAEDEEAYKTAVDKGMLSYILAAHEFIAKELNFSNKEKLREKYNFRHNEDDYFMHELAYTIRLVFLNDLKEY